MAIDIEFMQRFKFNATYSMNTTEDAFVFQNLAGAAGYKYKWINGATIDVKALEFEEL